MLDWIFGSSKGQKKEESQPQDKLSSDEVWVYDFVRQYLVSPIWRNPLLDFIEENCSIFEDVEENKFQYTKIFQEFTSLCAILVQSIVEETGITFKTLEKCIIKGLKSKNDKKIFSQLLICDDFQTFKRIMISKNKQLQAEALKKIREDNKTQDRVQDQLDEKEREMQELQKAIAMSLALQEKAKQQEQQQLQEAIRLSQISAKQEATKEEKPKQKSILGDLPPLAPSRKIQEIDPSHYNQQKLKIDKQIQELKANHQTVEEDAQLRKKRLQEQRQLLRKKKQEERQQQLKTFVENKQSANSSDKKVSQQQLAKRKKLMNRLKDQLRND